MKLPSAPTAVIAASLFAGFPSLMHAQPGLKAHAMGAASSPAGAPAGAAAGAAAPSTSNYQTGHVYRIRERKHVQYQSVTTQVFFFRQRDLSDDDRAHLFGKGTSARHLTLVNFQLDRAIRTAMVSGQIRQAEYLMRPVQPTIQQCNQRPPCDVANADDDTVAIVTVTYYDSIPRYLNADQRLRFSINQDTSLLLLQVYSIIGNHSALIQVNTSKVSNPYFRYTYLKKIQLPQENRQHTLFLGYSGMSDDAGYAYSAAHGPSSSSTGTANPITPGEAYIAALRTYRAALYEEARRPGDEDAHNAVVASYEDLQAKYEAAKGEYVANQNVTDLQTAVDGSLRAISDPDQINDTVTNRLNYVKALYRLATYQLKPPTTIPPNFIDEEFSEDAIPISTGDSASNFYFKVIHKATVNQPIRFISIHYATTDYGGITIPFRYRPPVSKAHIVSLPGTAATSPTIVTGPEESDATLNLSGYIGRKWGRTRFYEDPTATKNTASFELLLSGGPSLISLSAANIDSSSRYMGAKNNYAYTGPASMIAVSAAGGFVIQWKAVNFGLLGGLDFPLTGNTGWIYARKFWLGFGFGVNLGILSSSNQPN